MKSLLGILSYVVAGMAGLGLASYLAGMVLKPSSAANLEVGKSKIESQVAKDLKVQKDSDIELVMNRIENANLSENLLAQAAKPQAAKQAEEKTQDDIIIDGQKQNTIDLKFLNEEYKYDETDRKDPFAPYEAPRAVFNSTQPIGPMLPLQRFNVEELSVQGIIWGVENPTAMVVAPDKKIYYVKEREKIGKNNGYIAQIREGEVVIVESFLYNGEITSQVKILPIDTVSNSKK
ncbi:MAG: pilus assembly protein PilP [Bdellovibrionota bacterium]|nr:hypothetical protein [Pseudobdellovibrionaceae bacterium]